MVFQDYELIQTKRVNHNRRGIDPYGSRVRHALGGLNTAFTAAVAGGLAYSLSNLGKGEIIPTRSFLSRAGFIRYAGRAGIQFVLPVLVGYGIGIAAFGNVEEIKTLGRNQSQYYAEMKNYKQELLYA